MRAVIYARVSTTEQDERSIDAQLAACRDRCAKEGWTVAGEFADFGFSGADPNRPEYLKLFAAVDAKRADIIVTHELSRLWRSEAEMHKRVAELEYRRVRLVTLLDAIDSRNGSAAQQIAMWGMIAAAERRRTKERVHQRFANYISSRTSVGGGVCYGYRAHAKADGGTGAVVDPETAATVVWIFNEYVAGSSPRMIANALNARGVPSAGANWKRTTRRTDRKWLASAVNAILRNERYRGVVVWNRSERVWNPFTGQKGFQRRDRSQRMRVERPDLRIVPDELWNRAAARIRHRQATIGVKVKGGLARRAAAGGAATARYLFSGVIKCGACGANYVVSGPAQSYGCATRVNGGRAGCANGKRMTRAVVEASFARYLRDEFLSEDALKLFEDEIAAARAASRRESDAARKAREKRRAALAREIDNLTEAVASGMRSAAIAAKLAKAEAELADLGRVAPVDFGGAAKLKARFAGALPRYRAWVARFDTAALPSLDVATARRDLLALFGGPIPVAVGRDGVPVGHPKIAPGAVASIVFGETAPGNVAIGSGGRI